MPKKNISDISRLIDIELGEFNSLFKQSLKSKVVLVDLITRYILKQKGKKVRPLLVLLASKISGGIQNRSYRGAILVELLHTATLVHDDVVDNAETRRGFPSINAVWKNKAAVLMGDYLLAKGLLLATESEDFDFLKVISDTVRRMSEGELLQMHKTRKLDLDEETYFRIISDKTASLLSTCCEIGARASTDDKIKIEAMRSFGENLGMAFQIRDDILDFIGNKSLIGKPLGADIREKKLTLPLIFALQKAEPKLAKKILAEIKSGGKKMNVDLVIDFVKDLGGIEYANQIANKFAETAIKSISVFEDSDAKSSLCDLVTFVVERSK